MYQEISQAIRKIEINKDWLYHWVIDEEMLYSVHKHGILSKSNLRKNNIYFLRDNSYNVGCNGTEYISVCKKMESNSLAYQRYIRSNMAFIINPNIDKINSVMIEKEIKRNAVIEKFFGTKKMLIEESIVNSPDEFLVKDKISFNDIIGLKLPVFYDEDDISVLIKFLENINHDLPIIDVEQGIEIDKNKIKNLKIVVENG